MRAVELRDSHRIVAGLIARELARENLPFGTFDITSADDLVVAKTADRSVLGCMNDMAVLCEHMEAYAKLSDAAEAPPL